MCYLVVQRPAVNIQTVQDEGGEGENGMLVLDLAGEDHDCVRV